MAEHVDYMDIEVDGQHILGTLQLPGLPLEKAPGVLFIHGWGGSQTQYLGRAAAAAVLGCACLTFDLRGHAKTQPQYVEVSRAENLSDVIAAYETLVAYPRVNPSAIAVVGSSYGAYLGAILTTLRPVRWLGLRAPALYKDSEWTLPKFQLSKAQNLSDYRLERLRPEENRALAACAAFAGDALVVESEGDQTIPRPVIENYLRALEKARSVRHKVISEADHGLSKEHWQETYNSILLDWLTDVTAQERVIPS